MHQAFDGSKQESSYRSGRIALINGVFEVRAKLVKCNDLKNNRHTHRELLTRTNECTYRNASIWN